MNIVRKDIDSVNATLTISVEKEDYTEKVEKKLRDYRKKAQIPGFRPGMVPVGLLNKMYGKSILAEEINKILSDALQNYISDNKLNILGEPLPNETEQKVIDFAAEADSYEFVFDLGFAPELEVELNKDLHLTYYQINPSNEMVDNQIKSYVNRYGKHQQTEMAEEKDMLKGELVELDSEGEIKENGIHVYDAVLTPAYIKTEAEKAKWVGSVAGKSVVFNPRTDFDNDAEIASLLKIKKEEAAAIDGSFKFTIQSITRYQEAELNEELFQKVFGENNVTTEAEFREKIKDNIQINLNNDSHYKFGLDAREALVAKLENAVFPETFLKRWLKATNEKISEETIEADFPKMLLDLKWQILKNKIGNEHGVKVENEEVNQYARQVARSQFAQYGIPVELNDPILDNYTKEMLKKEDTLRNIIEKVYENKVFDLVKNSISLNTKEVSIEEFNAMFE